MTEDQRLIAGWFAASVVSACCWAILLFAAIGCGDPPPAPPPAPRALSVEIVQPTSANSPILTTMCVGLDIPDWNFFSQFQRNKALECRETMIARIDGHRVIRLTAETDDGRRYVYTDNAGE